MSLDGSGNPNPHVYQGVQASDLLQPAGTAPAPEQHVYFEGEAAYKRAGMAAHRFVDRHSQHAGGAGAFTERLIDVANPLGWWWLFKQLGLSTKHAAIGGVALGLVTNHRGAGRYPVGANPLMPSASPLRNVGRVAGASTAGMAAAVKIAAVWKAFTG